jgi:hypothetical protein
MERRNARRERKAGGDGKFNVARITKDKDNGDASLDGAKKNKKMKLCLVGNRKRSEARALIKARIGNVHVSSSGKDTGFKVMPSTA